MNWPPNGMLSDSSFRHSAEMSRRHPAANTSAMKAPGPQGTKETPIMVTRSGVVLC